MSSHPRICWIFNGPALDTGISGSNVRVREVAKRWEDRGWCSHMFVTTPGGLEVQRRLGFQAPYVLLRASLFGKRQRHSLGMLYSYVLSTLHFLLVWRRVPPCDAVFSVSDYFCDVIPALWLKRRRPGSRWIACVYHRETESGRPGHPLVNRFSFELQQWSFRRIARWADEAWVLDSKSGDEVVADLTRKGMGKERIYRTWVGVDTALIGNIPPPEIRSDAVMIGLRPNKGLHDIVPVWTEVAKIRPGTTLRLIGRLTDRVEALLAEVKRAGLGGLISLACPPGGQDAFSTADLYREMKSARVFFAPSHEEGWGIAVCEAMACGLPVIAYDLPVYRTIYRDAYVPVRMFDCRDMAAQICRILNDPAMWADYQRRGRETAARYEWSRIAETDWERMRRLCGAVEI